MPSLEKSAYGHRLYKLSLHKLLKQEESAMDLQAIKLVGTYLAGLAEQHPSQQYWGLVHVAFNHIDNLLLNEPRLRTFISIEHNMRQYFATPESFTASLSDLANVLFLFISRLYEFSQHSRSQMNIGED